MAFGDCFPRIRSSCESAILWIRIDLHFASSSFRTFRSASFRACSTSPSASTARKKNPLSPAPAGYSGEVQVPPGTLPSGNSSSKNSSHRTNTPVTHVRCPFPFFSRFYSRKNNSTFETAKMASLLFANVPGTFFTCYAVARRRDTRFAGPHNLTSC